MPAPRYRYGQSKRALLMADFHFQNFPPIFGFALKRILFWKIIIHKCVCHEIWTNFHTLLLDSSFSPSIFIMFFFLDFPPPYLFIYFFPRPSLKKFVWESFPTFSFKIGEVAISGTQPKVSSFFLRNKIFQHLWCHSNKL